MSPSSVQGRVSKRFIEIQYSHPMINTARSSKSRVWEKEAVWRRRRRTALQILWMTEEHLDIRVILSLLHRPKRTPGSSFYQVSAIKTMVQGAR